MSESADAPSFDKAWVAACEVRPAGANTLRWMIDRHYLAKWPAIITCALGMFCNTFAVGMVVFAEPPRQTSVRYGGKTWELARLWVSDDIPRNAESWLISRAVRYVSANYPDVRFLVSYADPSAGHEGTIYKAANWEPDGKTDDGRKSPRSDYVDIKTGKKYSRAAHIQDWSTIERVPRVSKYRFVYNMDRAHKGIHQRGTSRITSAKEEENDGEQVSDLS